MCDKRDRAITCGFCRDLHLTPRFSGPLQKDLFKGKWSLAKSCFKQNYCHASHSRFAVFFPLPSCCVSSLLLEDDLPAPWPTSSLLAQQENILVLDYWTGLFSSSVHCKGKDKGIKLLSKKMIKIITYFQTHTWKRFTFDTVCISLNNFLIQSKRGRFEWCHWSPALLQLICFSLFLVLYQLMYCIFRPVGLITV